MSLLKLRSGMKMESKDYLDLLMSNQKKVKDGFKFINLKAKEQATIEDCYETIKKDLEMLEILKKHVYFSVKSRCIRMREIYKRTTSFDYEDLKEWLRNV